MPISLYFHIPFCTKKCDYCHFFVLPDKPLLKQQLMDGLEKEWSLRAPLFAERPIETIYFGGGTPALLGPENIAKIIAWCKHLKKDAEVTLEANPENITHDLMRDYARAGINRVSIGVQSFDDHLLKTLGRTHGAARAYAAVEECARAGISNLSIDLMYDLPGQTMADWESTLQQAVTLPISHLSLYNLTFEPHTVFYKKQAILTPSLPDSSTSELMYRRAIDHFEACELHQYEISAFAKKGFPSRHNSGYWTGRPFLGFGPSAFSYWDNKRFRNIAHLSKYCRLVEQGLFPVDFEEELSAEARRRELLAVELRLLRGVSLELFQDRHGPLEPDDFANLAKLETYGLLQKTNCHYSLTARGILLYDELAAELI